LISVENQTIKPTTCLIVDNASVDETEKMIYKEGYYTNKNGINFMYYKVYTNMGGPGYAIYKGMELLINGEYDYIWMMDDDGIADVHELEYLLRGAILYNLDFANALVLDIDRRNVLSCGAPVDYFVKNNSKLIDIVNPFIGTLISCSSIKKIGLVKAEMLSWGIEEEYAERYKKNGYNVATVVKAKHYHPLFREKKGNLIPGFKKSRLICVPVSSNVRNRKMYYKNLGYIDKSYRHNYSWLWIGLYLLFRFKFKELFYLLSYYILGYYNFYKKCSLLKFGTFIF
jgi:hypothetical protein